MTFDQYMAGLYVAWIIAGVAHTDEETFTDIVIDLLICFLWPAIIWALLGLLIRKVSLSIWSLTK